MSQSGQGTPFSGYKGHKRDEKEIPDGMAPKGTSYSIVPERIRGRLADAWSQRAKMTPQSEQPQQLRINKIYAYDENGSPKIRTRPEVLRALLHDINGYTRGLDRTTATSSMFQEAMNRLSETGAFTDVKLRLASPNALSLSSNSRHASSNQYGGTIPEADLCLGLTERSYSLQTGVSGTPQGSLEAYTEGSLVNMLGSLETITCKVMAAKNAAIRAEWGLSDSGSSKSKDKDDSFSSIASPSVEIGFSKPTFQGTRWGIKANARMDEDDFTQRSRFVNKVTEADASFVSPNKRHSMGMFSSWRNPVYHRVPKRHFKADAPPEVTKACSASSAAGIRYMYENNRRQGDSAPVSGSYSRLLAEFAHPSIAGDCRFVRFENTYEYIASWGRRMPDTGYEKPVSRSQHNAAKSEPVSDTGLSPQPHPSESDVFSRMFSNSQVATSRGSNGRKDKFSLAHQISGWLAPGITARAEWKGGLLLSPKLLDHLRGDESAANSKSSFICDRYFLGAPAFRGFTLAGIGPSSTIGSGQQRVALGGDVMGLFTARLQLPPPIPSITLANAGMRLQLFASCGTLLSDDQAINACQNTSLTRESLTLLAQSHGRASAGIGIWLPIGQAAGLEATWTLWQHSHPSDSRASFSLGVSQ